MKQILINTEGLQTRAAVVTDGKLQDFFIERKRKDESRLVGSIFKGRVRNLEPSLQAAFVDIGAEKNAFLHYWDMLPATKEMLEDEEEPPEVPQEKPEVWRKLDVSILHSVILEHIMDIDSPDREKGNLSFSADGEYVLGEVDSGRAQLAFFLNPIPTSSVIGIADHTVRMPPKSTYFYPKTAAGLVINPLF